jgi:hypothetical protein
MTMVKGPWFFASFGGGWRFVWLRFVAEPIGQWLLGREVRARIAAWARACEDPEVLESL